MMNLTLLTNVINGLFGLDGNRYSNSLTWFNHES